jgi:serine/threonine protein kinase
MIGAVELEPGTLVDGWQIIRALRTGGFGAVHHVEQHGKAFALKVALHREQSGDTGRTHARALREVALLLTMDHPHIIKPRGFGYLPDGRVYCVLEYVDGWTLGEWLERTHPTFREIARVFAKIAGAIAYMHALGVLHRDLKLSNVMVSRDGEPVIIDLGCATSANAEELTVTPLPPGTERYRSPEARAFLYTQGRKPGARYSFKAADELFAVGVMLYELLTDPLPTKDNPRPDFADPGSNLPPPREANPRVPEALSALVEELLAHDPAQRPESFKALRRRLAELANHPGPEYAAEAHPPSAQRQPPPVDGGQAAGAAARGRQGWRKVLAVAARQASHLRGRFQPRVLAGMVAAVMVVAVAAVWLARGERPAPALPPALGEASAPAAPGAGPPLPPVKSSPGPAPAPALDSAPIAPAEAARARG